MYNMEFHSKVTICDFGLYHVCSNSGIAIVLLRLFLVLFGLRSAFCSGFSSGTWLFLSWERLLVRCTIVEVHLWECVVDFGEYITKSRVLDILRDNLQYCAQLLILLLKSQFLVHVCDALL